MAVQPRVEPETEVHRTEKALRELAPSATLPFAKGVVEVKLQPRLREAPAAQHLVSLLVHLLLRMKGVVREIWVEGLGEVECRPGIPLQGSSLLLALQGLADSLRGPKSRYVSTVRRGRPSAADVTVVIGDEPGDVRLGADAWRALTGEHVNGATWSDECPLGPYMAAVIGATEVFKHLLATNYGWTDGVAVKDLAFSLLNYGVAGDAGAGPDMPNLSLDGVAIAGCGAGGTAVLYTLGSFPMLTGKIVLVEPGSFKLSNLNRYLLSTYAEVHAGSSKLESARGFLEYCAPALETETFDKEWSEVPQRPWDLVVSTVDTPHARWDVQRSLPRMILDGGVLGTLYAVLRVVPEGWCLECKHPPDPDITIKKRAAMWGVDVLDVRARELERRPVSAGDLARLAEIQGRPVSDFAELLGMPFDEVPAITECGETPLSLRVPSQAPVLPFATTAAGIAIAAEVVKQAKGVGTPLNNHFAHDLRYRPKERLQRFKPKREGCQSEFHQAEPPAGR